MPYEADRTLYGSSCYSAENSVALKNTGLFIGKVGNRILPIQSNITCKNSCLFNKVRAKNLFVSKARKVDTFHLKTKLPNAVF